MKLRILFTLAILVALAAAPGAQAFRWQAGESHRTDDILDRVSTRVTERIESTLERLSRSLERAWDRTWDRTWSRLDRHVDARLDHVDRIEARIRERVNASVNLDIRRHLVDPVGVWDLGQGSITDPCGKSRYRGRDDDYEPHCEVREESLPAGRLTVDAAPNGSITVESWDRNEVRVSSIVRAHARRADRAREIASAVRIQTGGGRVTATGPDTSRREWWSVGYRISVPARNDLDLHSQNGGISIAGVSGRLEFETTNGGVTLRNVGGDVHGRTRNGGVNVELHGDRWNGSGLDVETTNGGVTLALPSGYNAELEARTHNGGFRTDYPITITGDLSMRRGISTTLGSGGPPVRVRTTNGGFRINRR